MIEGVIAKRIDPITRPVDAEHAVLPLHHAAVGDVNKTAVEGLNLQGRNAIGGVDDNAPAGLLGRTA